MQRKVWDHDFAIKSCFCAGDLSANFFFEDMFYRLSAKDPPNIFSLFQANFWLNSSMFLVRFYSF